MSWGLTPWSMSTIVASGSISRIAPFIAPTYSPGPESAGGGAICAMGRPARPSLTDPLESFLDPVQLAPTALEVLVRLRGPGLALLHLRLSSVQVCAGLLQLAPLGPQGLPQGADLRRAVLDGLPPHVDRVLTALRVRLQAGL